MRADPFFSIVSSISRLVIINIEYYILSQTHDTKEIKI